MGIPSFSRTAQVMMTTVEQKQSYESFWNKAQRFYVWQPWQMCKRSLVVKKKWDGENYVMVENMTDPTWVYECG